LKISTKYSRSWRRRKGRKERGEANCFLTRKNIQIASLLTIFQKKILKSCNLSISKESLNNFSFKKGKKERELGEK